MSVVDLREGRGPIPDGDLLHAPIADDTDQLTR